MTSLSTIVNSSKRIDDLFTNPDYTPDKSELFSHEVNHYSKLIIDSFTNFTFFDTDIILVDRFFESKFNFPIGKILFVDSLEKEKSIDYLEIIITRLRKDSNNAKRIIGIGGGVVCNTAAYIAEQISCDLLLFPTTVLAMSDAAIGGKVRVNHSFNDIFLKHHYKSIYVPKAIIIDPAFIDSMDPSIIKINFAEIIKHALYQSNALATFLLSSSFNVNDSYSVLRAILWTVELKNECLRHDPNESNGSRYILRAAHDISDHIEEVSRFTISHAEAVLYAMSISENNLNINKMLISIYSKFELKKYLVKSVEEVFYSTEHKVVQKLTG